MPYEFTVEDEEILEQWRIHEDIRPFPASVDDKYKFGQVEINGLENVLRNMAAAMSGELPDMSEFVTDDELADALADIDLSSYATLAYVDTLVSGLNVSIVAKMPLAGGTFTGQIVIPNGTVSAPGMAWNDTGSTNTGLYRIGNHQIGVTINAAEVLDMTQNATTINPVLKTIELQVFDNGGLNNIAGDKKTKLSIRSGQLQGIDTPSFFIQTFVGTDLMKFYDLSPDLITPLGRLMIGDHQYYDTDYGIRLGNTDFISWAADLDPTNVSRKFGFSGGGIFSLMNAAGVSQDLQVASVVLPGFSEGDLVTFDASHKSIRIARGSALQVLRVNAAATGYEFADESGGGGGVSLSDDNDWSGYNKFLGDIAADLIDGFDAIGADTQAGNTHIRVGRSTGDAEPAKFIISISGKSAVSGSGYQAFVDAFTIQRDTETGWGDDYFRILGSDEFRLSLGRSDRKLNGIFAYTTAFSYLNVSGSGGIIFYGDGNNDLVGLGINTVMSWGPSGANSGAYDTALGREDVGVLRVQTGKYDAALKDIHLRNIRIANSVWLENSIPATSVGAVVAVQEAFDASGSPLGYVPIHASYT